LESPIREDLLVYLILVALLALPFVLKEMFFVVLGVLAFIILLVNLAWASYLELRR